jgi:hypothetical protein
MNTNQASPLAQLFGECGSMASLPDSQVSVVQRLVYLIHTWSGLVWPGLVWPGLV